MTHDKYLWHLWRAMRERGIRVSYEVGVPEGRVDLVRVGSGGDWLEFYEAKVREPVEGIAQLHRYRIAVGLAVQLTLVVPSPLDTAGLREEATACGVRVMRFDAEGIQERLFDVRLPYIDLPYHWPQTPVPTASSERRRPAPTAGG